MLNPSPSRRQSSPFTQVPVRHAPVDLSGMTNVDFGAGFKAIGAGIEKYKLDKEERGRLEGTIEGKIRDNPEVMEAIQGNEDMSKLMEGLGEGLKKDKLQKLAGFISSYTLEQDRRVRSELAGYQRDKEADVRTNIVRRRRELNEISSSVQGWVDRGIKREDVIKQLTPTEKGTLADMQNILRGDPTSETDLQARTREYNMKILTGNLNTLDARQRLEREELERRAAVSGAVTPDDARELAEVQQAAQVATARGVPGQLETASDMAKEQLATAQYMNSADVRDMDKASRKVALAANLSLINARKMATETQRQKILASMNPSDSAASEANDKELKAALTRIVKWEDDDGKEYSGTYEKWLEKFSADDDLIPSRGIIDNEDKIKGLFFEQEQIGGRNRVWLDDSPAQQAQQGTVSEFRFRDAARRPIEEDPSAAAGVDPTMRAEIINRARAQGISEDEIRVILGE